MRGIKHNDFERLVHRVDSVWDGELDPYHIKTVEDELTGSMGKISRGAEQLEAQIKGPNRVGRHCVHPSGNVTAKPGGCSFIRERR